MLESDKTLTHIIQEINKVLLPLGFLATRATITNSLFYRLTIEAVAANHVAPKYLDGLRDLGYLAANEPFSPTCECGAVKTNTTHSSWCPMVGMYE